MKTALLLYGKNIEGGGGAERRFIRVFEYLKKNDQNQVYLIVNNSLFKSLLNHKLVNDFEQVIVINDVSFFSKLHFNLKLFQIFISKSQFRVLHLVLIQKSLIPFYLLLFLFKGKKMRVVGTVADYRMAYRKGITILESFVYYLFRISVDHIDSLYPSIKLKKKKFSITPRPFTDYSIFFPKEKENIVLFAGRLHSYKNPILFVESVIMLLKENDPSLFESWKFMICGTGPLKSRINDYIVKSGFEDRFFLGKCNNISDLVSKSKIFVSLQTQENYPSQSLIEAIVTENNVIVSDVGDSKLLFHDGFAHFINLDVIDLKNKLYEIITTGGFSYEKLNHFANEYKSKNNVEQFKNYLISIWYK